MDEDFILIQEKRLRARLEEYEQIARDKNCKEVTAHSSQKIGIAIPFIKKALEKIHDGIYGICESCGEQIPQKRLQLVPGAIRCVQCEGVR